MLRLFLVVVTTILAVAFIAMNLHYVTLSLVVGPPLQIRLIFILAIAFVAGFFSAPLARLVRRARRRGHQAGGTRRLATEEVEELLD
jgi:uncharacterized integral membrane protein